jgi:CheY-like chemotaxis protein/HPt (histidine-containing phosphotransfer) domain-containing protein
MDRLFKSFSQVDASISRKFGGTGLGLAISKKLAEMMGGQIGIESEEGKGSKVWFTAAFEKQPRDRRIARPVLANIRGLKVLVANDNAANRIMLCEQLRSWGCLPEEAVDGESTLLKMRQAVDTHSPFDVVLLDAGMPDVEGTMLGRKIKADPKLCATALIMLTSCGNRGDAKEMQEIGFAAYLTKPVKDAQLRDCLALAVSRKNLESRTQPMPIVTRHSISEDRQRRIRILLTEDNMINQEMALGILEKMGYRADAVTNGKEVLSVIEKFSYDLILMDVQMPEMDGFEATAAIRAKEGNGGRHIPIIAMTAHAMKGDRERCLRAGMDDYLTKPIQAQILKEVIGRWVDHGAPEKPEAAPVESLEASQVFDKSGFLERVAGDESLFRKLLSMFLKDTPVQIERIQQHLKEADLAGVQLQAHSLNGATANICANALQKAAFEIEAAAKNRDLDRTRDLFLNLPKEFERFKDSIAEHQLVK